MPAEERQERVVQRRLQMILRRRITQFTDLTIYKGGFVNINDLLTNAPLFKRFEMTVDQLKDIVNADTEGLYTLQGDFLKVNTGHSFDIDASSLPALPSN